MTATPSKPPVPTCGKCDQPHLTPLNNQACAAHLSRRRTAEGGLIPCGQPPVTSLTVCRIHGASSALSRAQAQRSKQAAAVTKAGQIFGIPRQVDPAQGLIEEYWRTAGLVAAYEQVVAGIPADDLVWGVVERVTVARGDAQPSVLAVEPRSGEVEGNGHADPDAAQATVEGRTVHKASVNTWLTLFNAERDRFAKLGVEIVRLGLEARRDEYIRAQVEVFASVLLSPELALTAGQRAAAGRLLRGLGARDTVMIDGEVS